MTLLCKPNHPIVHIKHLYTQSCSGAPQCQCREAYHSYEYSCWLKSACFQFTSCLPCVYLMSAVYIRTGTLQQSAGNCFSFWSEEGYQNRVTRALQIISWHCCWDFSAHFSHFIAAWSTQRWGGPEYLNKWEFEQVQRAIGVMKRWENDAK